MLFDDDIGFIMLDKKSKNISDFESKELVDADLGFLKGNMFKNEYEPYKNYTYRKLNPTSKKEQLLFELMKLSFAINDLNLLLDINPKDSNINKIFKKYVEKYYERKLEFVKLYGPIVLEDSSNDDFDWINNPWPWDKEDSAYV